MKRTSGYLRASAARRLAQIRASRRTDRVDESLLDLYARAVPELDPPEHMAPIVAALERAATEPIRLCFSTPPQHGKSTLVFVAIAWWLRSNPRPVIYATYNDDFATKQMRKARRIAQASGLAFDPDSRAISEWRLLGGGELHAGGIGGGITGLPGGIVIVDDPHKNWAETQSKTIRDKIEDDFDLSLISRLHPTSPVIVIATRWHEDDLIGRLGMKGWEVINLPAIDDQGRALWPKRRPVDFLERQRAQMGDLFFSALYQGRPRPPGNTVFGAPVVCSSADVPAFGVRAVGVDLSYTAKTKSDYSVHVDALRTGYGDSAEYWITNVVRRQCRAPDFAMELRAASTLYPGAEFRWYAYGPEIGTGDFIVQAGVPLRAISATGDKFVRSQAHAAPLWNAGRVRVVGDAAWSMPFLSEVQQFTGVGDANDDQVDALVAALDALATTASASAPVTTDERSRRRTAGLRNAY